MIPENMPHNSRFAPEPGSRTVLVAAVLVLALLMTSVGCTGRGSLQRFEFTRVCMGVQAQMIVFGEKSDRVTDAAASAFHLMAELDTCMSDYRVDSELNRLSDAAGGPPVPVSRDLLSVLRTATDIARASGGSFDPTVGPCVKLWRDSRKQGTLPPADHLAEATSLVGWSRLQLDERSRTARLTRPGMRLDLGGIAKGYAAQRAVNHLRGLGFSRCLVALAGDVAVGAAPPDQPGWRVAVESCDPGHPVGTLWLKNAAVSTSGGCEQFVEIGGVRYAHIVDPRTGLGSSKGHIVSVVAPMGEYADALSTAAFLLGPGDCGNLLRAFPRTAAIFTNVEGAAAPPLMLGDTGMLLWERSPQDTARH